MTETNAENTQPPVEEDGEPGQVTDLGLGIEGDPEPLPEGDADAEDTGPDELGTDADDTTDETQEIEVDESVNDDEAAEPAIINPGQSGDSGEAEEAGTA